MDSVNDKRQRPIVPQIDRHYWRYRFFEHLRNYKDDRGRNKYQSVVKQDLHPLWKAALREPVWLDMHSRSFESLIAASRRRDPLAAYVARVRDITAKTLRLTHNGGPARWAWEFVHADVEPQSAGGGGFPPPLLGEQPPPGTNSFSAVLRNLRITVNPAQAWMEEVHQRLVIPPGERTGTIHEEHEVLAIVHAGQFMRFNEWEKFRQEARSAVTQLINDLEAEYRSWYDRERRPSTDSRWEADAKAFAMHLLNIEHPIGRNEKDRIRSFAQMISADLPPE